MNLPKLPWPKGKTEEIEAVEPEEAPAPMPVRQTPSMNGISMVRRPVVSPVGRTAPVSPRLAPQPEPEPEVAEDARPVAMHAAALHGAQPVVQVAAEPPVVEAEPLVQEMPRRSRNIGGKVAWTFGMAAIGAVVGVIICAGIKFIDGPVEGTPTVSLAQKQAEAASDSSPKPNMLSGMHIQMNYPYMFDKVGQVKSDAHAVEEYNLGSSADYSRMIAVSVRDLPTGKLLDDSGYRFRTLNTEEYKPQDLKIGAEPAVIMNKTDKKEATLFWGHGKNIVTVSITSNNPKDDLVGFMKEITTSLKWRQ